MIYIYQKADWVELRLVSNSARTAMDGRVFLYAFDLLELDGRDLRREPR
jgi:ATP-dependent DNA ligase